MNTENNAKAIIDFAKNNTQATPVDLGNDKQAMLVPHGKSMESLKKYIDEYAHTPDRFTGKCDIYETESFIEHYKRFQTADTALFALRGEESLKIQAIYNYGENTSKPGFGDHSSTLFIELSDEWKEWVEHNQKGLTQYEFAAFVENNIEHIQNKPDLKSESNESLAYVAKILGQTFADQKDMMNLSRGVEINEKAKARTVYNRTTGERSLEYTTEQTGANGEKLKIPGLFLIAIPIFEHGAAYRIPVKLRYRVKEGNVAWFIELFQYKKALKDAQDAALNEIKEKIETNLFIGQPVR